jgi:hypothetical protein
MTLALEVTQRALPFPLQKRTKYILATSLFAIGWLVSVAYGFSLFLHYDNKPGAVGATPRSWPGARFARAMDRPTLVMVAHPRCPCTRASIDELAQIMARTQGKLVAYVLFVIPQNGGAGWEQTDLRRSAEKIPGVTVLSDVDGVEANRFGAETSGYTLLFGADGHLLFSGGITESRGHAGGNAGESAIVSLVNNRATERNSTFVFGCALVDRKQAAHSAEGQK